MIHTGAASKFDTTNLNRSGFEISAVVGTGLLKFVLVDALEAKFWFILLAGIFWCTYIGLRIRANKKVLKDWGFRTGGFWPCIRIIFAPAVIVTMLSIGVGTYQDHIIISWHMIPILILYPIWGTIQQFLILSLFGGNLSRFEVPSIPTQLNVFLTAVLFSIVHYPSFPLMVGTFFLAVIYMFLFIRFKNLWALGLFHGWIATIFYFFALGRDPWLEFIGSM